MPVFCRLDGEFVSVQIILGEGEPEVTECEIVVSPPDGHHQSSRHTNTALNRTFEFSWQPTMLPRERNSIFLALALGDGTEEFYDLIESPNDEWQLCVVQPRRNPTMNLGCASDGTCQAVRR